MGVMVDGDGIKRMVDLDAGGFYVLSVWLVQKRAPALLDAASEAGGFTNYTITGLFAPAPR